MQKFLILLCLIFVLGIGQADAARRYRPANKPPVVEQKAESGFYWTVYGGYNTGNQLVERGSTGSLNYNGNGSYYMALEANFVGKGSDLALGIGYTGLRPASNVSGLVSGGISGVNWSSLPIYLLTRYKLNPTLYVTLGVSYSLVELQGASQINALHGSTSFSLSGNLGYSVGVGLNLNKAVVLDLKYLVDRGNITLTGGANNGLTFPLEAGGFVLSLGYRI